MATLQTLDIKVNVDSTGASKGFSAVSQSADKVKRSVSDKLNSLGRGMTSVGKTASIGLTLPLIGFGKVALDEFGEAQRVAGQTEAVLKSTGGQAGVTAQHVADLGSKFGDLSAQDNEVIQAGENMLLTFTNIRNEAGKGNDVFDQSVGTLTDLAAAMGTEPKQAAIQLGKALNDPVKGITALTRVGVTFDDQQKKTIEQLVKGGDTMGAQKVILAELNKEFGGSAAAMGAAATPTQRIGLAFKNLAEQAGGFLAPMLATVTSWLTRIMGAFQHLSPGVQHTIVVVAVLLAALGPVLVIVGKLVQVIGLVSKAFTLLAANPAVLIWIVIGVAVVALTILIIKNWSTIKAFLLKVWRAIAGAWSATWNAIKRYALSVWNALKAPVLLYVRILTTEFNIAKAIVTGAFNVIKGVALTVWHAIGDVIGSVIRTAKGIFNTFKSAIVGGWHTIESVGKGIWDGITGAARTAFNGIASLWNNTIGALSFHVPDWVPGIGGKGFDVPDIPLMAAGGVVKTEGLAYLHPAEVVSPAPPGVAATARAAAGQGGMGGSQAIVGRLELVGSEAFIRGHVERTLADGRIVDEALTRRLARRRDLLR